VNKLWVRLSLAFTSVVLIAVIIVIASGILISRADRFENFEGVMKAPGGLVETLANYYRVHQSWVGVDSLLRGAQTTFSPYRHEGMHLFVADANERIVHNTHGGPSGPRMRESPETQIISIQLEGKTVGYLGVGPRFGGPPNDRAGKPPAPFGFLSGLLLSIAGVGGVLGVLFGVLMSRSLTAPLNRLAEGARAIGARDLSRRVEVGGSDEIREVAQAFNEMAQDLEQAEQLRRNLIADVAHELRTPLTVMQGNLRAILDDVYALEKGEITRIYDQTRLLGRLVNDLHELAKAEARKLPLNFTQTDLLPLLTGLSDTFAPVAESRGVSLQTDLPDSLPAVQVDQERLLQVLHNLLNNGLRHTPSGGKIIVSAQAEADHIWIEITDTGEGIPPEHLPHIFERFYRTDPARTRDKGGAGLGLAIARAIIEAHGGQISANSRGVAGQGSSFAIQLPRQR